MNDTRIDKALEALDKREAEIIANASAPPVMRQILPGQPASLDEGFTTHLPGGEHEGMVSLALPDDRSPEEVRRSILAGQWSQTLGLRFVQKVVGVQMRAVLQQQWRNGLGETEWVDVPLVAE